MKKLLQRFLCACIIFYRKAVSPHFPSCCRYYPTCSEYALESIKKYGPFKGFAMAISRILRCNPFHKGGYDPVP
ncbi:membrane protein insertion efficiency factor YidD [Treponema pedis]|uniref:Putative membrane protein insertion efficiency factor n=1 Tax=Treponema pedis TaxID=409322 RepID=A0A7S7AWC4_9SPIR|nr:membrane protein insertion efficiency factor YidD [Treponema pedis]QOW60486.1 membrane protein insertion efficiency factor YidD [Treponema pedis]QSI05830.1 membrane protein insertion efficiency factor YidD [Treponema pedis]